MSLIRQGFGPLVTSLLERRAPVLLRIAMVFTLTDKVTLIEERHVKAAAAWVRYWSDSVRFIFRSAAQEEAQHEVTDAARKIVEFLEAKGRQPRTKITTECFQGRLPKDKIDAALDELLQSTPPVIVVQVEPRPDGPGSGTKFYRLAANSAKSANSEHPRGLQPDLDDGEVCELCEVSDDSGDSAPTRVRTVRTVREVSNPPETRANTHSSQSSQTSQGNAESEEF